MQEIKPAKTVKEVLIAARWILDNVGWCQGYYAKDAKGTSVHNFKENGAACFCTMGAFHMVETDFDTRWKAIDLLKKTANFGRIVDWNDKKGRTKEEVLQVFDQAIKKAGKQ